MSLSLDINNEDGVSPTRRRSGRTISSIVKRSCEDVKYLVKGSSVREKYPSRFRICNIDPQGEFLQLWKIISLVFCVIAVSLDPLFFYIPVLNAKDKCLSLDQKLKITTCVLRSFTDLVYLLHIIFQFRTGFRAPPSRVFPSWSLPVTYPLAIAQRYLPSYFVIDVLSILPIPQVGFLLVIPSKTRVALLTEQWLKYMIFCQYVPRLIRIRPLWKEITGSADLFTETAGARAAFNLFLYMTASHFVGACWYLFAIEQEDKCWKSACKKPTCDYKYLYCGENRSDTSFFNVLNASCPHIEQSETQDSSVFDFGIFLDALQSHVAEKDFTLKFCYCFWWGLRNLSSLGQNLKTSASVGEIFFAVFISVFGLLLFASLIANMQRYLQSATARIEEMMQAKRQEAKQLMSHLLLPLNLRERIKRYEEYKWQTIKGVDEETLIRNLPKDLRRDIRRHLFWDQLKRVPLLEIMDGQVLDAMCDHLKPVLYTQKSIIFCEGDSVDEMLFIMRGKLFSVTTDGGRSGFFNSNYLQAGDFCGEEILTWALGLHSSNLPLSTRTVESQTDVEAFSLTADDLKIVVSRFPLIHSKQFKHVFRFYSQQWRTWAACFIQASWRQYCRRKLKKSLHEAEDRQQVALTREGRASISLGPTIYASKFAANTLRNLRRNAGRSARLPKKSLPLLPQKPAEPDFSAERHQ